MLTTYVFTLLQICSFGLVCPCLCPYLNKKQFINRKKSCREEENRNWIPYFNNSWIKGIGVFVDLALSTGNQLWYHNIVVLINTDSTGGRLQINRWPGIKIGWALATVALLWKKIDSTPPPSVPLYGWTLWTGYQPLTSFIRSIHEWALDWINS
jgi:hypothetical protein